MRLATAVVLVLHGGGFVHGTPATERETVSYFRSHHVAAVALDYPLDRPSHGLTWLKRRMRGYARRHVVYVWGGSAGGTLALKLASTHVPRAVAAVSPVTDVIHWVAPAHMPEIARALTPRERRALQPGCSRVPTFIQHGTLDTTVPFAMSLRFARRCGVSFRAMRGQHHVFDVDASPSRRWLLRRIRHDQAATLRATHRLRIGGTDATAHPQARTGAGVREGQGHDRAGDGRPARRHAQQRVPEHHVAEAQRLPARRLGSDWSASHAPRSCTRGRQLVADRASVGRRPCACALGRDRGAGARACAGARGHRRDAGALAGDRVNEQLAAQHTRVSRFAGLTSRKSPANRPLLTAAKRSAILLQPVRSPATINPAAAVLGQSATVRRDLRRNSHGPLAPRHVQ